MLGVLIALVISAYQHFVLQKTAELIFLTATNFLFWWYVITSAILAVILIIIILLILLGGTAWGANEWGVLGGILGFLGGGALSAIILILTVIARGALIYGTYLLHNSLIIIGGNPQWNLSKVIFGTLLLLIGLIMSKGNKSHSSKN